MLKIVFCAIFFIISSLGVNSHSRAMPTKKIRTITPKLRTTHAISTTKKEVFDSEDEADDGGTKLECIQCHKCEFGVTVVTCKENEFCYSYSEICKLLSPVAAELIDTHNNACLASQLQPSSKI